jgi:hypothetical protein
MPMLILTVMNHITSLGYPMQLFGLVLPEGSRYSQSNRQNDYEEYDNRLCSN